MGEYPGHGHAHFFNRQFWTVFKLYKNVLSWAGILADNVLSELVLDKLLNRYLLMSLRANLDNNDSVMKSKLIVDLLPKAWLVPGSPEMAKMTMLTRYMSGLGCCQGVTRTASSSWQRLSGSLVTLRRGRSCVSCFIKIL